MWNSIQALDRILRGEATALPALRRGEFDFPIWGLLVVIDMLGLIYGLCMGVFALNGGNGFAMQVVATMLKVPALFLLTLLVTLPSLYVFNAMVGSRLYFWPMLRLLVACLAVMLAVLASIGPIVGFFSFTTTSHAFMVLLNVLVFSIAGCLGMAFLLQTLHRLSVMNGSSPVIEKPVEPLEVAAMEAGAIPIVAPGPLNASQDQVMGGSVKVVFRIWVLVFGLVGVQMAWVLRPFIGRPHEAFSWFKPIGSNFFEGVLRAITELTR